MIAVDAHQRSLLSKAVAGRTGSMAQTQVGGSDAAPAIGLLRLN